MKDHEKQLGLAGKGDGDLASLLDELGEMERSGTPTELVDRLYVRTQSAIARDASEVGDVGEGGDVGDGGDVGEGGIRTHALGRWSRARVYRIAASVLLVGGGALVVQFASPNAGTTVAQGTALMQAAALNLDLLDGSIWDDSIDTELAVLMAESAMLNGELDREPSDLDLFADEGAL